MDRSKSRCVKCKRAFFVTYLRVGLVLLVVNQRVALPAMSAAILALS
jgi:hypothetical protein